MTATATTCSPHRQRPFLPAPAMTLSTVRVGLRRGAGADCGVPARSAVTTARSARVRALSASPTRSANSSSVSAPSAVRSLSSSTTASRSAADARNEADASSSGVTAAAWSAPAAIAAHPEDAHQLPVEHERIMTRSAISSTALHPPSPGSPGHDGVAAGGLAGPCPGIAGATVRDRPWEVAMRTVTSRLLGLLLILLGAWGGIVAYVGPRFDYRMDSGPAWDWTTAHWQLHAAPGGAVVLGGLLLLLATPRAVARLGAVLAILGGMWLVVGPLFAS